MAVSNRTKWAGIASMLLLISMLFIGDAGFANNRATQRPTSSQRLTSRAANSKSTISYKGFRQRKLASIAIQSLRSFENLFRVTLHQSIQLTRQKAARFKGDRERHFIFLTRDTSHNYPEEPSSPLLAG
ncbi:MAG: hypothetical protein HC859_08075 [Bacteroidia bacterium]|nr:hypothetical protein [Bacteroidia bacterium]